MSNIFKKITAAISTFMVVFSIIGPVAGVNATYSSSLDAANKLATLRVLVDQSANPADYRLGDNLSRRELIKIAILLSSSELNTAYAGKFSDVPQSDWAWKYAETAVDNGFIAANATFSPSRNVSKGESLKVIMNATGVEKANTGADNFWADYVTGAVKAGIVESFSDYDADAQRGWIFKVAANALESSSTDTGAGDLLGDLLGGLDGGTGSTTTDTSSTGTTTSGVNVLSIALSADTPEAATIPASVSGIPVASYDFTAGSEDVTVTSVVVKRKGLSDLDTLTGIAAFSSDGRASQARNDSQNNNTEATLTLTNGFVVKAGETRTLTLVADVANAVAASNAEFALEVVEVVASTTAEKDGSLVGSTFKVGSVDAATLTVQTSGSVSNPKIGQEGVNVFKFQVRGSATEDILLKSITVKADNSNVEKDLTNFKLLQGSTEVAATPSSNNRYVTFSLGDGITIGKNKVEKFTGIADIVAGANDAVAWSIERSLDISAEDTRYGYGANVSVTAVSTAGNIGTFTIQAGELTIADIDPASDKIRENKTDVVLGKIKVTNVAGKNIELQRFGVYASLAITTNGVTAFVDDGKTSGIAGNNVKDGGEVDVTKLTEIFQDGSFELYNEDTGASYPLDTASVGLTGTFEDLAINLALPQGVSNFALRADTQNNIGNFNGLVLTLSLNASKTGSAETFTTDGQFYAVETETDRLVTDLTPSTLSWKTIKGTESGATLSLSPLSSLSKVRGAKGVVGLQFEVEADVSSAVSLDELKVYVQKDTGNADGGQGAATNATISKVSLYKGSVSDANLLDEISGSNLAAGYATFNGFKVDIAANTKQSFVVTVDFVDGATTSAAVNSPYTLKITASDISARDDDSTTVNVAGGTLTSARNISITDAGTVTLTEDANNDDNIDIKTILGGTSKKIFSIDVQATNENVDVDTVEFTVNRSVKNAVGTASLYLGDTLITTNTNSNITDGVAEVSTITVSAAATATANATVTIDGVDQTVALTNGDATTAVATKIATAINGNTYNGVGYSATALSSVVTITAQSAGVRTDTSYTVGTTGATAVAAVSTNGTDSSIKFRNMSTLIFPQETRELKLALNTESMGFEKVGTTTKGVAVTGVYFSIIEGVDSGKPIDDKSDSAITTAKVANIVPAAVTPSSVQQLSSSSSQAKFRLTADFGSNTQSASNSTPNVTVNTVTFSMPGATGVAAADYVLYEDGKSGEQVVGRASGSNVVFNFADKNGDGTANDAFANGTISSNKTYVIVPTLGVGDTASLTLLKDGVNYDVVDVTGATAITTQLSNEIDLGTRTFN